MKKLVLLSAAALCAGCMATGNSSQDSTAKMAGQTITLEQALEKSAQTREKLLEAKQQYQQAKIAAEVASGQKTASQAAQDQIQQQLDSAKKQLKSEKEAWAELLK